MTARSVWVIESGTRRRFPRSPPMGDGQTIDREERQQGGRMEAWRAQHKTRGPVPHTLLRARLRKAMQDGAGGWADLGQTSPLAGGLAW